MKTRQCECHVGDSDIWAAYEPCRKPAPFTVLRGPHSSGPEFWTACLTHATEAQRNGSDVEGLDEATDS